MTYMILHKICLQYLKETLKKINSGRHLEDTLLRYLKDIST